MKIRNQLVSGMIISILVLMAMFTMVSCNSTGDGVEGTSVSIGRDGIIQSQIEEGFGESYYDKDELQQAILAQAAAYNNKTGNSSISVEKVEMKNDVVVVLMTYASADDYASFNKSVFYNGNAQDAINEGYELNVVLSGVKNAQETVGKADILALEDAALLITDISDQIVLDGTALYVSDNVTVSNGGKAVLCTEDNEGLAYIIYK